MTGVVWVAGTPIASASWSNKEYRFTISAAALMYKAGVEDHLLGLPTVASAPRGPHAAFRLKNSLKNSISLSP
jgi:hypothetical protein